MKGKGWECSSCDDQQKLSRNCSLELSDEDIDYEEDNKVIHINSSIEKGNKFSLTCGKYRFHICPVGISSEDSDFFLRTYFLCEKFSCLPEEGGLFDQNNRIVESFEIISSEISRHENDELNKQKQEIEQQKRKCA